MFLFRDKTGFDILLSQGSSQPYIIKNGEGITIEDIYVLHEKVLLKILILYYKGQERKKRFKRVEEGDGH